MIDGYSHMDQMKINKKKFAAALEEQIRKGEDLTIEKYEGSFAISKDYTGLLNVRAVVDLENGKIKIRSVHSLNPRNKPIIYRTPSC